MANQFHSDPIPSLGRVNEYLRDHDFHQSHHHQPPYPRTPPAVTEHSISDVASILGLSQTQVTPEVMAAAVRLLSELDRVRWQEDQARRRMAYLEGLAERDDVAGVLNRRGFMREMEALLSTGGGEGLLVVLHVVGIEAIRQTEGLVAGDAALRHIATHLVGGLRTTDLIGLLGVSDFALLLPATGFEMGRRKVREVMERINAQPFLWNGQTRSFALFSGYHILLAGEGAEQALAAADRARRGIA